MIRLYRARFSTNVERVALALAHKGLEVESVWIEYSDRSPVERVSGQSLVPVVELEDGAVVFDSMQIVRVLEELHPSPPLYPADAAGRARMIHFIDWFNDVWKVAPNAIEAEIAREQPDVARIEELSAQMATALDHFEQMLVVNPYLFGTEFSAADCAAYPFLRYGLWREPADDELFHRVLDGYQQLGNHPRLTAWIERMDERPRV
ncbi:MAG TPA: glutathione S-transferase family protein [Solirubrobacteraceae bacterium]|nr:glutathione S-transferase family protein [Solirubrobacteraceae bacterium]